MIAIKDLRKKTYEVTFIKGQRLYKSGNVREFSEETLEENGREVLTARVRGSTGKTYKVEVVMDGERDRIIAHRCTCPAHSSYSGLCKHCVAVMFQMIEGDVGEKEGQKGMELEERLRNLGVTKGFGALEKKEPEKLSTTAGLKEILKPFYYGEGEGMIANPKGEVKLLPQLSKAGENLQISFRIGITQMYVLKNLSEFASRVRARASYYYGKKLEFIHSMDAFSKESLPFVELILRKKEPKGRAAYTSYFYRGGEENSLSLNEYDMDEVMELLAGKEFIGDFYGYKSKNWSIESGHPDFQAVLKKKKDGAEFSMKRFVMNQGREFLYFWREGVIQRMAKEEFGNSLSFFLFMQKRNENFCNIGRLDMAPFLEEILPPLKKAFPVRIEELETSVFLPETPRFEIYLDMPQKNFITAQCVAVYEKARFYLWDRAKEQLINKELRRNWKQERLKSEALKGFFQAYSLVDKAMVLEGEEACYHFLTEEMEGLKEFGEVFISDEMKRIRIRSLPRTTVGISMSGGMLNMTLDTELSMEELCEILSRYDRKKKYYRLKNGDFVETDQSGLKTVAEILKALQIPEKSLKNGRMELPKYRALYLDEKLSGGEGLILERESSYKSLIRNMKTVEDSDFEVPNTLKKVLRGYQQKGFLWLKTLSLNGFGGILADDMGLGKTLQVIAFLLSKMEESGEEEICRTLIVAPASLIYNWENEIRRFAPSLAVKVVAGSAPERKEQIAGAGIKDILVTSYDLLKRDEEEYGKTAFFCQVLDEAQYIKNAATKGAKAAKNVRAEFKLALTGTPVENRLGELWSIFDYLMPGFLYGYERFKKAFEGPIVKNQDEEAMEGLRKMIRPFILRRVKKDVLKDLPDKLEKNMFVRLEKEQRQLYQAHAQRLKLTLQGGTEEDFKAMRIKILAELTKLRQLCCNPGLIYQDYRGGSSKEELCLELLENAVQSGHKVLLFSQFTSMLELLEEELLKRGIAFYSLTGDTKKEKRIEMMNAFNEDDTPVFCISLKAGGTGLNLVGADMVIHYDPWWNAAAENQATDRAHRIGQKNVVTVYKLVAEHTIEEKVLLLQQKKKELAEQVLGGKGMDSIRLDRRELLELFEE